MRWTLDWRQDWRQEWRGPEQDTSVFPGQGPSGSATFALDLEDGYTLTWRWPTNVIKSRSGKEQRISRNDAPKESYAGSALLFDDQPAATRATLARFMALGDAFLLGLPHESATLTQAASGTTVYVTSTSLLDWKNPGQRVIVESPDRSEHVDGVIQSTTSTSITLDVAPGLVGGIGGRIMPSRPVYLEPEQQFDRYPVNAERWNLQARAATFDFAMTLASLALGPLTSHVGLDSATVTAKNPGAAPTFAMIDDSIAGEFLVETPSAVEVHYTNGGGAPGQTTVADLQALLLTSSVVQPTGIWGSGLLTAGDAFAATALTGGDTSGPIGTGATVETYASHPVWDRPLSIDDTNADSIQAMTEILDFGGVPYAVGSADYADWGRTVAIYDETQEEWQWLKLFLATVKGRQKAFWLSTWREDLTYVSHVTSTLTVEGDVTAWYPLQRQHLHVQEADGSHVWCAITAVTDNGDGTFDVTTDAAPFVEPVMVSWLELARFGSEEFSVEFKGAGFEMRTTATVVQR